MFYVIPAPFAMQWEITSSYLNRGFYRANYRRHPGPPDVQPTPVCSNMVVRTEQQIIAENRAETVAQERAGGTTPSLLRSLPN